MGNRVVFIDRDGTINVDCGYVSAPKDFELLPGIVEGLQALSRFGIHIYIVTNQSGIARGLYTEQDFHVLTEHMLQLFRQHQILIDDVLFCPHHPEGKIEKYKMSCSCRKPGTKLFETVIKKYGFTKGNIALIGDKNSDIEAGRALGATTYLVESGYGAKEKSTTHADVIATDLREAVFHLLKQWRLQ